MRRGELRGNLVLLTDLPAKAFNVFVIHMSGVDFNQYVGQVAPPSRIPSAPTSRLVDLQHIVTVAVDDLLTAIRPVVGLGSGRLGLPCSDDQAALVHIRADGLAELRVRVAAAAFRCRGSSA